jgi:hypothetical protein
VAVTARLALLIGGGAGTMLLLVLAALSPLLILALAP